MMPEQALMKMLIHTASDSCWGPQWQLSAVGRHQGLDAGSEEDSLRRKAQSRGCDATSQQTAAKA